MRGGIDDQHGKGVARVARHARERLERGRGALAVPHQHHLPKNTFYTIAEPVKYGITR